MSFASPMPPILSDLKSGNVVQWMRNTRTLYNPLEQARWNQSNIDALFYAGEQRFINSYFQFYPSNNFQSFQFPLIQQPINMVTGYQRQHRKSINYVPIEGSKQEFSDDLTTLEVYNNSLRRRLEKFSKACEYAAISGMCLIQPYLDFRGEDPVNGVLDLDVWSYNSYFADPFYRDAIEMSDCNFVWTQKYITKEIASSYFPDHYKTIQGLSPTNKGNFSFYFLPENYNAVRNNFIVVSQIWYQTTRTKKVLYNRQDGLTYDFYDDEKNIDRAVQMTGMFEVIEMEVPTWNVAVCLNDQVVYNGHNPLKFDKCPFIPVYWCYDPHISQPDLRVRSLTRSMRDVQFLMNRRIIINHDISESSINTGFIRKEDAVVNEDDLKYSGQGKDIIIKRGFELTDVQKIIPNAVPPSDMELANQLADLIFRTSGVNQELMGMAGDSDTGIETMLKQGAGLVTLQKFFDQWDMALKQLGVLDKEIMQYNWSATKVSRILGKAPPLEFQTKIFSQYNVLVEEGLNTTIQKQSQFVQILKLNEALQGIIPPKFILENATIHGKTEIIEAVEEAQKQASQVAQQESMLKQAQIEAQIQSLQARSISDIGLARERHARSDSNIGLFEERLSAIEKNRSMSLKAKQEALRLLLENVSMYGEVETTLKQRELDEMNDLQIVDEEVEKDHAEKTSKSNDFIMQMLDQNSANQNSGQNMPQQSNMSSNPEIQGKLL